MGGERVRRERRAVDRDHAAAGVRERDRRRGAGTARTDDDDVDAFTGGGHGHRATVRAPGRAATPVRDPIRPPSGVNPLHAAARPWLDAPHDPCSRPASPFPRCPRERSGDNLLDGDLALLEGLRREGAAALEDDCRELGACSARPSVIAAGFDANDTPPRIVRHDRSGRRIDDIEFHPAWHRLMGARRRARHRRRAVGGPAPRRPRRPRGPLHHARPGRGRDHLPAGDDLLLRSRRCGSARTPQSAGSRSSPAASTTRARFPPPASAARSSGWR